MSEQSPLAPPSPRGPSRRTFLRGSALAGGLAVAGLRPAPPAIASIPSADPARPVDYPTCCPGPFANGVASGDPLPDRVILWTRLMPERVADAPGPVRWEVATDPGMTALVRSGEQTPVAEHDFTVKVDVTGLAPAATYYYRFTHAGDHSITGRTRTAPGPGAAVDRVRIATMSCSSYWSSFWSGFEHIAARDDLDLVLHVGDYVYDFPDRDELVRSRVGFDDMDHPDNRDWLTLSEVRRRYALWRSDPQFVRAHQQHPWMIVWDNHDIDVAYGNEVAAPRTDPASATTTLPDTVRAFHEWTPTRPVRADGSGEFVLVDDGSYPTPQDPLLVYRALRYGDLVDVVGIDAESHAGHGLSVDSSHLPPGQPSLLGRRQYEWLTATLTDSSHRGTRWRVIGNQAWFAPTDIPEVVQGVAMPKLGIGRWGRYPAERDAIVDHLRGARGERIWRNVMVTGDAHGNFASDVISTAYLGDGYLSGIPGRNTRNGAEPQNHGAGAMRVGTGNGGPELAGVAEPADVRGLSVGVEFSPTSMGRGGADDMIRGATGLGRAESTEIARAAEAAILTLNRNAQFVEWVDHGYGIIDLDRDRAVFEFWWQDKQTPRSPDVLGHQMVAFAEEDRAAVPPRFRDQIDAVELHGLPYGPTAGAPYGPPAPWFPPED
ncbi:alkaline phosphatase D family protein [Rhodococcus kronopolitis]|uniref:Alkaline phosphatase D family protein n=1 Tax=Rhodococcus kronopolitis TaxID=1460226 RepID=A0ABV9FPM0_9NOCA